MAETERARRVNQESSVIGAVKDAKRAAADQAMREDLDKRAWEAYGRRRAEEDRQEAERQARNEQYNASARGVRDTTARNANTSNAQEQASLKNRSAQIDKQIANVQSQLNEVLDDYDRLTAHGNARKGNKPMVSALDKAAADEAMAAAKELKSQLTSLRNEKNSVNSRLNAATASAHTTNQYANRDTELESNEASSREHARAVQEYNRAKEKIADIDKRLSDATKVYKQAQNALSNGPIRPEDEEYLNRQLKSARERLNTLKDARRNMVDYANGLRQNIKAVNY